MKKSIIKVISILVASVLAMAAFSSCGGGGAQTDAPDTAAQTPANNTDTPDTDTPDTEPAVPVVTPRYGISNGQWGQFSRYEYNGRGQLASVTAISPFTLAPMCYERIKYDRVYIYGDDGSIERVWLSSGFVLDMTLSPDGLTAEGSCTKDSETIRAKLTFSDKKLLVREEYSSHLFSLVNEYDADGNIVKVTQDTGFVSTHSYSEGRVSMTLEKTDGTRMAEYTFILDGTRVTEITAQGESVKLTYENGLCTKGEYNTQTYTMEYDSEGRVISTHTGGEFEVTETFGYDSDGRISKYTREKKTALSGRWEHEVVCCTYTYAPDGTVSSFKYERAEYDNQGMETFRLTEEY